MFVGRESRQCDSTGAKERDETIYQVLGNSQEYDYGFDN